MKLYWAPQTRSIRAIWMLEEAGVTYERFKIDIRDESSKANPSLRAASPMGKVPALEDGAVRIWDSGAICAYIADQYPANKLAPPIGDAQRGEYLMWLMFTNSVIEPAMGEKVANIPPSPARYGWGSWDQMLITLRQGVGGSQWVLGERFSAADVLLGMSCIFLQQFKMVSDEPILAAYAARCSVRPALQRALAIEAAG
ncbi:MAG: glutathione S-transferase family protein [Candidatus Obscuribacterales bacterium]|nr:glutathione S-transferase family protein [Steroidobacteraceae bacterium]